MNKSLGRDMSLLSNILKNQNKIECVMRDFKCDFSQSSSSVSNNVYAFDLCAMYMAQIGESVKLLTDETKSVISQEIDLSLLRYFRNMIDHAYDKVNKPYLQAYIQLMISSNVKKVLKDRYIYCTKNKRK